VKHTAIGLMSGTSLDGVDIAYCEFEKKKSFWDFRIIKAQKISYSEKWTDKLTNAPRINSQELIKNHVEYGHYLGKITNDFLKKYRLNSPDIIASHGHTIYHQPGNGFTFQIGDGSAIAAKTRCTVVCDFRSMNVASGGQGAPIVPIGDELLFGQYDACLNLGGFANISFKYQDKRLAFDICPVNFVINYLVKKRSKEVSGLLSDDIDKKYYYDPDGKIASLGSLSVDFISDLNDLAFYKKTPPKSLGAEWVDKHVFPLIEKYNNMPLQDILRSFYEHITCQVKKITSKYSVKRILVTGGGGHNKFLIKLLKNRLESEVFIPADDIIDYKEAIVFAFLGVLRINNMPNILKSASGGKQDNISGAVYEGK